jgi:neutral amino acid transport system substrate-binding protein
MPCVEFRGEGLKAIAASVFPVLLARVKTGKMISLIVASLLVGALTACQQTASPQAAESQPAETNQAAASQVNTSQAKLKLGVMLPASGSLAAANQPVLDVLPLIAATANACGGVNGLPIELVAEDDQADPKTAAIVMNKLAKQDHVSAVLGNFANDAVTTSALRVAVQNHIPVVSPNNTSPGFTSRSEQGEYQGYWARTIPSETQQAIALAQLAKQRGLRTVSTLVRNDPNGIAFEQAFVKAFEKLGGIVLNKANPSRYAPQSTATEGLNSALDYNALAAFSPNGKAPDGVVMAIDPTIDPTAGSQLLQAAYAEGLARNVQILLTNQTRNSRFVEAVGQAIDGKFFLNGAIGTSPTVKSSTSDSFYKLWQDKIGSPPKLYVPQAWDAVALMILAAQAAHSNRGEAIKNQLQAVTNPPGQEVTDLCEGLQLIKDGKEIDYDGISGTVDLDKAGDVAADYEVWTIDEKGKIRAIDQITPNP